MKRGFISVVFVILVFGLSALVHEFGHSFVGTLIGYDIMSVTVDVFTMTGWTAFSNPRNSLHWMFALAGGVFQGVFLFGMSFLVKSNSRYVLWYLSIVCLVYGIVEMVIY